MAETKEVSQASAAGNAPAKRQILVDESGSVSHYANFCRVTGTPEELVIDFGLNAQPLGSGERPIQMQQQTVVNYYTAKRLLNALAVAVKTHEDVFGELEIDIKKRARKPGTGDA